MGFHVFESPGRNHPVVHIQQCPPADPAVVHRTSESLSCSEVMQARGNEV